MIGHVQTSESEATAKKSICIGCGLVKLAHEETKQGPLCRGCCDSATVIRVEYVINGRIFTKDLKRPLLVVVNRERRKEKVAVEVVAPSTARKVT